MSGTAGAMRRRLAKLDIPSVPLPPPPTRAQLAGDLVRLAIGMERVAVDMEYLGGFGELAAHGRELAGAARIARGWAKELRKRATQSATERGRG